MNKTVFSIFLLFVFAQISYAQTQIEDSTEAYNYWTQRGIIEMVYAYMQDYKEAGRNQNKELSNSENDGIIDFKKQFIDSLNYYDNSSLGRKFDDVSFFLQTNSWKECEKNIFRPLKKQFESFSQLNEAFFNCKRKDKNDNDIEIDFIADPIGQNVNKRENWNQVAVNILNKYKTALDSLNGEIVTHKIVKETSISNNNPATEQFTDSKINNENRTNSILSFSHQLTTYMFLVSLIIISLIIGFLIGRIHVLRKAKREIDNIINNDTNIKDLGYSFSKNVFKLKQGYNKLYIHINSTDMKEYPDINERIIKRKIDEYPDINKNPKQRFKTTEPQKPDRPVITRSFEKEKSTNEQGNYEKSKSVELKETTPEESTTHGSSSGDVMTKNKNSTKDNSIESLTKGNTKILYFSMPESNGSFKMLNGEHSNDGRNYYKIDYNDSTYQGELFFISSERDQKAINYLDSFLKPVCDIENISNAATATKIELIQSGKVTFNNDSWIIDTNNKIKIKLL